MPPPHRLDAKALRAAVREAGFEMIEMSAVVTGAVQAGADDDELGLSLEARAQIVRLVPGEADAGSAFVELGRWKESGRIVRVTGPILEDQKGTVLAVERFEAL